MSIIIAAMALAVAQPAQPSRPGQADHAQHQQQGEKHEGCCCKDKMGRDGKMSCCAKHGESQRGADSGGGQGHEAHEGHDH